MCLWCDVSVMQWEVAGKNSDKSLTRFDGVELSCKGFRDGSQPMLSLDIVPGAITMRFDWLIVKMLLRDGYFINWQVHSKAEGCFSHK